jgi:undecaprenyl diphosphate synthase
MKSAFDQIDLNKTPRHVAVIMDGNGRWAKTQGKDRIFGHFKVEFLTLYAFSTENWNRPKEEVDALMDLLVSTIISEVAELMENGVRLLAIGDIEELPMKCRDELKVAIAKTADNTDVTLVLALNYSARWEMVKAVRAIIAQQIPEHGVTADVIAKNLSTANIPDPELLIRTSGEHRISNFLLWQIAYTELHFTPIMWPEFREEHFFEALVSFQGRERRFGMTSEQTELTK